MDTTLVVLAAGMGSRFGGLKQIEPVGPNGEIILDFSVHDAVKAGFNNVVFIIKKEFEDAFKATIGHKTEKIVHTEYVYQELGPGRKKPYGTGQAILCCKDVVKTPFAVINADDFYGYDGFNKLHDHLVSSKDYAMVGFLLENTLTENGSVSRGICDVRDGYLHGVKEHTEIYAENDFPQGTVASMNMWGLQPDVFSYLESAFEIFLKTATETNELYLSFVIDEMIQKGIKRIRVLETTAKWYGVTYREDKEVVTRAMDQLIKEGLYRGL